MNILKQANRFLKQQPIDYHVSGSESAFSSSIEELNNHPNAGLMSYDMYVRRNTLNLWSTRRGIYKEYYHWCQVCKQRLGTQLHHLTYKNLGHEEVAGDVVLICKHCHFLIERDELEEPIWREMKAL